MRVRDWMSPDPLTVESATEVAEARHLLNVNGIRHLPVVEHGRLVGMISDRDVRDVAVHGSVATDVLVEAVMSAPAHVIGADEPVEAAARRLLSRRISGLPVVDEDGILVGVITTTDCLLASLSVLPEGHEV